jgi:hypothetical protein
LFQKIENILLIFVPEKSHHHCSHRYVICQKSVATPVVVLGHPAEQTLPLQ